MRIGIQNKRGLVPSPVKKSRGFTIVEMTVALGIFTIVLFMTSSAFFSIVNADRKSRATRIATDNLNLVLEDMSRKIKTGVNYKCGGGLSGTFDCTASSGAFSFNDQSGQLITYKRAQGSWPVSVGGCGDAFSGTRGCILRRVGGSSEVFMLATSPEIDIKELKFWVSGSSLYSSGDKRQPAVAISIWGYIGPSVSNAPNQAEKSTFRIQTAIVQRTYDNY